MNEAAAVILTILGGLLGMAIAVGLLAVKKRWLPAWATATIMLLLAPASIWGIDALQGMWPIYGCLGGQHHNPRIAGLSGSLAAVAALLFLVAGLTRLASRRVPALGKASRVAFVLAMGCLLASAASYLTGEPWDPGCLPLESSEFK